MVSDFCRHFSPSLSPKRQIDAVTLQETPGLKEMVVGSNAYFVVG